MSRRGENIYKRKDGRWEGRYIKRRDKNHKAVYGYLYGKTYTEVKNKLKEIKLQKSSADIPTASTGQIVTEWLENRKLYVKESTLAHYKAIVDKHILPLIGEYDISAVSADIVQEYIKKLIQQGYAGKTINDILTVIKSIFKYSVFKGVEHNCDLSSFTLKNQRPDIDTLTTLEQKRLCRYLIDNLNNRNFGILLSLCTGIRIGELCALKWSDIDIKEKILIVDKTMIRIQNNHSEESGNKTKVVITPPKSIDSVRKIPVPDVIVKNIGNVIGESDEYILTGYSDRFMEPRNMQYYFKKILKKCSIKEVNFHVLRHTFATICVEKGFEIKSLSEILGHSNVKITLDRYVHSSMELKRKNMDKLDFLSA